LVLRLSLFLRKRATARTGLNFFPRDQRQAFCI